MNKSGKFISIIFSLILILSLVSLSAGFDSNANKDETTLDPNDQRPYSRENAARPLNQGGYSGGHDTITAEGMLLKEEVHKRDPDTGEKFNKWVEDNKVLPYLRTGAHDEDSTKTGIFYLGSERPIGPNGDGNFFQHFLDPDTGKGLLGFSSALDRAMNYVSVV